MSSSMSVILLGFQPPFFKQSAISGRDHSFVSPLPLQLWVSLKRYTLILNSLDPFHRTNLISGYKIKEIEEEMARSQSLPLPYKTAIDESAR